MTHSNLSNQSVTTDSAIAPPNALLAAHSLSKSFGGVRAVDQASIQVPQGSITGLIGPNGAGKTTLFNLLSNFTHPDQGQVVFDGVQIQQHQPHQIAQLGLVRTFQVARVLSRLSVMENMLSGYDPGKSPKKNSSSVSTPWKSWNRSGWPTWPMPMPVPSLGGSANF
jgi:ABC-type branched-subunit amino acid transport system ATPase component